jgi:hypothetical protein
MFKTNDSSNPINHVASGFWFNGSFHFWGKSDAAYNKEIIGKL